MRSKIRSLYLLPSLIFTSSLANAGGLYIREFGQPSQATAGSGAQVLAEDASTAFQNPAGLFKLDSDSSWMVTGVGVFSEVKFKADSSTNISGNNGGDAGGTAFGGALFHTRKLNDQWG